MVIAEGLLILLALVVVIPLGIVVVIYLIVPACKAIVWVIRQVCRFIGQEIVDALRLVGSLVTALVLVPLTIANVLLGRWSSASHYGRAIETEGKAALGCVFRLFIGNPARLLCLTPLTEGLEQRVPQAVAAAPGADRPRGRANQFDGYTIIGSLSGGGSGGRLYVAEPTPAKLQAFIRAGRGAVDRVVIKSFSLAEGSTLPQIVRENRALPAANRLGLILEHELNEERFFYVTRYVPGESLGLVTQRLHALSGGGGLNTSQIGEVVRYAGDIVSTLCQYHSGGLWHKDVKPDNIIISDGRAHLVDFGLVTPLRSSMTLTTHGTEYFRDPEMVRMALRGVKVHEVDGAKFDVYGLGAVLYSMIENSFPAHGGLSQISKNCPEALRWIVRRAMTDYDKRYANAAEMLADLRVVADAPDPFLLKPVDLPSMRGEGGVPPSGERPASFSKPDVDEVGAPRVGAAVPSGASNVEAGVNDVAGERVGFFSRVAAPVAAAANGASFGRMGVRVGGAGSKVSSSVRVTDWWTGKYLVDDQSAATPAGAEVAAQFANAREHARKAREVAGDRLREYRKSGPAGLNAGVIGALAMAVVAGIIVMNAMVRPGSRQSTTRSVTTTEIAAAPEQAEDDSSAVLSIEGAGPEAPTKMSVSKASRREKKKSVNGNGPVAKVVESVASEFGPPVPLGRVLVLNESSMLKPEQQATMELQIKKLIASGFQVVGAGERGGSEGVGAGGDYAAKIAEIEMLASLRSTIGVEQMMSSGAERAIRRWMDEHRELSMVIWMRRDNTGNASTWMVARSDLAKGVVAKAQEAMRTEPTADGNARGG